MATQEVIRIFDIMATNVYWDFESNTVHNPKQHKFLVSFYPTGEQAIPNLLESITAYNEDRSYVVDFKVDQKFTPANLHGWIHDATRNTYWYMVNIDDPTIGENGFLPSGKYTIEVKGKDGSLVSASRIQDNVPQEKMLATYTQNRDEIKSSFRPEVVENGLEVNWKGINDFGGPDGYYIFRFAHGHSAETFDTQNLLWWDNIFLEALFLCQSDPDPIACAFNAGRNRRKVSFNYSLQANTSYGYFVELTDSNVMGKTNLCIFQPHHFFVPDKL